MSDEIEAMAHARDKEVELRTVFVPGAMADLAAGRAEEHDRKIVQAAAQLNGYDAIMLAQFSMAAAAPMVQAQVACPVLTSPGCAVLALRHAVADTR
jgi:hypothetical protein